MHMNLPLPFRCPGHAARVTPVRTVCRTARTDQLGAGGAEPERTTATRVLRRRRPAGCPDRGRVAGRATAAT